MAPTDRAPLRVYIYTLLLKKNPHVLLNSIPQTDIDRWKSSHIKTIRLRRNYSLPSHTAADKAFVSHLRDTLKSWGVPRPSKLIGCREFSNQIVDAARRLDDLCGIRIEDTTDTDISELVDTLWDCIESLQIKKSNTRLMPGTKTIHHLLPNLVPPIDGTYTAYLFDIDKNQFNVDNEKKIFSRVFKTLTCIARGCSSSLKELEAKFGEDKTSFNTSIPKILDNTIIGYCKLTDELYCT